MFLVVKIKVSRGGFYIRTQLLEGVIIIKVAADYSKNTIDNVMLRLASQFLRISKSRYSI